MAQVFYKIYIPFCFGLGNNFNKSDFTINEFDIDDVHIKLHLSEDGNEEHCYLTAVTQVEEDGIHDLYDISDLKIGKRVQDFFDGLSKSFYNAAFFNVFNGDEFVVKYEVLQNGGCLKCPAPARNRGFALDDDVISKAIKFANLEDNYIKQAFTYMKEAEYLVEIGRFNNAIIQFAVMTEYLINYQLNKRGMLKDNGEYKTEYEKECKCEFIKQYPEKRTSIEKKGCKIPFYFSKYVYGLSRLGLELSPDIIQTIKCNYLLRNKLAHGYDIYEAFRKCDIKYDNEQVSKYNIWVCMMTFCNNMNIVYELFEEHFGSKV